MCSEQQKAELRRQHAPTTAPGQYRREHTNTSGPGLAALLPGRRLAAKDVSTWHLPHTAIDRALRVAEGRQQLGHVGSARA